MFDVQGNTQILTFQIAGGQWAVIQAPASLGWNSAELAQFARGVQVLVTAQQGRGRVWCLPDGGSQPSIQVG